MRETTRTRVFLVFGGIFLLLFCYAVVDLPSWGSYRGPYGDVISRLSFYAPYKSDPDRWGAVLRDLKS